MGREEERPILSNKKTAEIGEETGQVVIEFIQHLYATRDEPGRSASAEVAARPNAAVRDTYIRILSMAIFPHSFSGPHNLVVE